jgi:hypothetical protein
MSLDLHRTVRAANVDRASGTPMARSIPRGPRRKVRLAAIASLALLASIAPASGSALAAQATTANVAQALAPEHLGGAFVMGFLHSRSWSRS